MSLIAAFISTKITPGVDATTALGDSAHKFTDLWLSGTIQFPGGGSIVIDTTTGLKIGTGTTQKIGFFNVSPVVQPSAYTQTYSTASKTNPTATAANLSATASTQTTPWGFATQAQADNIATQVNKMQTDYVNLQKLVNSIIDDLQSLGLLS